MSCHVTPIRSVGFELAREISTVWDGDNGDRAKIFRYRIDFRWACDAEPFRALPAAATVARRLANCAAHVARYSIKQMNNATSERIDVFPDKETNNKKGEWRRVPAGTRRRASSRHCPRISRRPATVLN